MRKLAAVLSALVLLLACGGDDGSSSADTAGSGEREEVESPPEPVLRMNQIQVLGSHNSYHLRPEPEVLAAIAGFSPELAAELDYEHVSLTEQLEEHGIRQFELDVYADPDGGRFAERPALELIGLPTASGEPALDEPGFKVLHNVDIDFRTTCLTLVACLGEIEAFSSADPDHLPIMIMIETKQQGLVESAEAGDIDGIDELPVEFTEVLRMDRGLFDGLEAEVLSVFDRDRVITPDDVRGDATTLEEAVLGGDAWPTLDEARGKVLFALVDTGTTRDVYVGDTPSLEGRLMFTSSEPGRPDAAFVRADEPRDRETPIADLVRAGYLVRTRTDVPAVDAVTGDITRRDAAIASGAQYLSTDYYLADPALGTGFVVDFEARCNPLLTEPDCTLDR